MARRSPPIPRMAPLQRIAARPIRVLVVAAEDTWRGAVSRFLTDQGFDVKEADSADRARAELTEQWFEVVVLDLSAPTAEARPNDLGTTVLQALSARRDRPGVVAFATDPDSGPARTARDLGAVAILDRHADLAKLPVGDSLGWKICNAWHWRRRQLAATGS